MEIDQTITPVSSPNDFLFGLFDPESARRFVALWESLGVTAHELANVRVGDVDFERGVLFLGDDD